MTIDAARARVNCDAQLDITSDGPLNVNIVNCPYARPKGATPPYAPLSPPTSRAPRRPDARPAAGLGSCNPPQQVSDQLTVGTPDANGAVELAGSVRYRVLPDDVQFAVSMTDVRKRSTSPTTPASWWPTRPCGSPTATTGRGAGHRLDTSFPVTVPCAATAGHLDRLGLRPLITANSLLPGAVTSGDRAIWELGQVTSTTAAPTASRRRAEHAVRAQGIFAP